MPKTCSVSEITNYIKNLFRRDSILSSVSVAGEISNLKYHTSGHIYFTLKDQGAELRAVMFAGERSGLKFTLSDGQKVEVSGRIGVYDKAGSYQLYASGIVLSGEGELYRKYLELKDKLSEMGMFDARYKRPIPAYASSIGIVTAIGGAALRDIVSVSLRRNPYVRLVLCPAKVQGEGAAESIAAGIRALDGLGLDTLIVGRGGGSIEDLWAFNEEIVAAAIFDAKTPIISAVGHETDFTIADFAADLRAATPSAAAELANFVYGELDEELCAARERLRGAVERRIREDRRTLLLYRERLKRYLPSEVLSERELRLKELMKDRLYTARRRAEVSAARLDALSPLKKISGGYGFVTGQKGEAIRSISEVSRGADISIYISDGIIGSRVTEVRQHG